MDESIGRIQAEPLLDSERGVMQPTVQAPATSGDYLWQNDTTTELVSPTVFDLIQTLLP